MVEVFLDLKKNEIDIMMCRDNYIFLYDSRPINQNILNDLYTIVNLKPVDRCYIITHAYYSTDTYADGYLLNSETFNNSIYNGYVPQIDLNKVICVLHNSKIEDIRIFDKMVMYLHFMKNRTCVIDNYDKNTFLLLGQSPEFSIVNYVNEEHLDKNLLHVCRKCSTDDVINFNNFIDYGCLQNFANYVTVYDINIFTSMTVFGFFKFIYQGACYDIDTIKFDTNYNTFNYNTVRDDAEVNESKTVVSDITETKVQQSTVSKNHDKKKKNEKRSNKDKKHLETFSIVFNYLVIISFLGVLAVYIFLGKKNSSLRNDLILQQDKMLHYDLCINKLNESIPSDVAIITSDLVAIVPESVLIASIVIDDDIELVCYVPDSIAIDDVINALNKSYKLNGNSDGGLITLNGNVFNKVTISISK